MSGLVSGIAKVFTSVAGGVAKLGSAVRAVGASLFTASAATGGGLTSGLLNGIGGGGGVLSTMLGGAIKQGLTGALIGGIAGAATGQGFGKGALLGGGLGAAAGGISGLLTPTGLGVDPMSTGSTSALTGANTPTGAVPRINTGGIGSDFAAAASTAGAVNSATQTPGATSGFRGLGGALGFGEGGFFRSEGGAGLLAGLGGAAGDIYAAKATEEAAEADRKFLRNKERRLTDSYEVDDGALVGGNTWAGDTTYRPTPATAWAYNPSTGMIERGA